MKRLRCSLDDGAPLDLAKSHPFEKALRAMENLAQSRYPMLLTISMVSRRICVISMTKIDDNIQQIYIDYCYQLLGAVVDAPQASLDTTGTTILPRLHAKESLATRNLFE